MSDAVAAYAQPTVEATCGGKDHGLLNADQVLEFLDDPLSASSCVSTSVSMRFQDHRSSLGIDSIFSIPAAVYETYTGTGITAVDLVAIQCLGVAVPIDVAAKPRGRGGGRCGADNTSERTGQGRHKLRIRRRSSPRMATAVAEIASDPVTAGTHSTP